MKIKSKYPMNLEELASSSGEVKFIIKCHILLEDISKNWVLGLFYACFKINRMTSVQEFEPVALEFERKYKTKSLEELINKTLKDKRHVVSMTQYKYFLNEEEVFKDGFAEHGKGLYDSKTEIKITTTTILTGKWKAVV